MKKVSKAKYIKQLHARASELWKLVCHARDGRHICMVKKFFPNIAIEHNGPLQVDHCITRGNHHLFYDTKNGTVVCSSCNRAKHFKQKSIDRAIDDIVKKREGKYFDYMVKLDQSMTANVNWNKIWWLEEVIRGLEEELEEE